MASFSLLLLKHIPLIPLRLPLPRSPSRSILLFFTTAGRASADPSPPLDRFPPPAAASAAGSASDPSTIYGTNDPLQFSRTEHPDYRRWKDKEEEILQDIEPITFLTKEILHSNRYMDGESLTAEDEKAVAEKLLAYHPHSEDKIGCGLNSIMVDRHPQFKNSRCLFVIRTDGVWIDFSYQKCLRAYIREKYPSYAERFIREHFKRSSS